MKRDNKKALYESIMTSVAKEVKKALNEDASRSRMPKSWGGYQSLGRNARTPKSIAGISSLQLTPAEKFANKCDEVFQNYDIQDLRNKIAEISDQLGVGWYDLIGILDAWCKNGNAPTEDFVNYCTYIVK